MELDEAVLRDAKFCAANPNFDPYLSCFYVGMTGLDPEVRFENHKRGYKACRYVTRAWSAPVSADVRIFQSYETYEDLRQGKSPLPKKSVPKAMPFGKTSLEQAK